MLDEEKQFISKASNSLIVGLLKNPSACDVARGRLKPDDFDFVVQDQLIYRAILALQNQNKSLDDLTIAKYVDSFTDGEFSSNDVTNYLRQLRIKYSDVYEIDSSLNVIMDYLTEIQFKQFGAVLTHLNLNPENSNTVIQKITEDFNEIIGKRTTESLLSFAEVVENYVTNLEDLRNRDDDVFTGTDTGFTELNHITNG